MSIDSSSNVLMALVPPPLTPLTVPDVPTPLPVTPNVTKADVTPTGSVTTPIASPLAIPFTIKREVDTLDELSSAPAEAERSPLIQLPDAAPEAMAVTPLTGVVVHEGGATLAVANPAPPETTGEQNVESTLACMEMLPACAEGAPNRTPATHSVERPASAFIAAVVVVPWN